MRIFVDSANIAEIRKWVSYGVADGVTTNPTVMLNDGVYDLERGAREIAELVPGLPVSVELTTNDLEEMVLQAREFASWASNIVVKVPVINEEGSPCLGVIRQLHTEGIHVNATVALSLGQVMLAAKAGATFVSIFAGRVADEGHNAPQLIANAVDWLERWQYESRIIVGSIREVSNIQEAALAGAHIITIPPLFLSRMMDHKYSRETVRGFVSDAHKALEMMGRTKA